MRCPVEWDYQPLYTSVSHKHHVCKLEAGHVQVIYDDVHECEGCNCWLSEYAVLNGFYNSSPQPEIRS